MKTSTSIFLFACTLALAAPGGASADCSYQAPREAGVDAAGATALHVEAGAGSLRIEGRAGAGQVTVRGTACASSESRLNGIELRTERRGSTVYVKVEIDEERSWLHGDSYATLDLVLDVPAGLALDVEDGSGPMSIRNVASAKVHDGSGEMELEHIAGEVRVTDGSGEIAIRDAGSVVIEQDGSGAITIAGVRGSVTVRDDGSGSIAVRDVGGDFTVDDDGSGGISHDAVRGRVRVPGRD
jgi:hypothetical protein